jgi:hypothetical protein
MIHHSVIAAARRTAIKRKQPVFLFVNPDAHYGHEIAYGENALRKIFSNVLVGAFSADGTRLSWTSTQSILDAISKAP